MAKVIELLVECFVQQMLGHNPRAAHNTTTQEDGSAEFDLGAGRFAFPSTNVGKDSNQMRMTEGARCQQRQENLQELLSLYQGGDFIVAWRT